ncbi:MAG: hypothetical protein GY800_03530 [Planctomycetes bacterium]|nr:hypothetical protein [Planctomycetota bacterium]
MGKEETDIAPHKKLMPKFRERFGEAMSRDALVHYIEDNDLEDELSRRAIQKWEDIEASIKVKRKKKGFN